jgi:hypothetical protein
MKLRLNKLMAGLVMAGGVMALVGCGGGGAPDLVTKASENLTVKATAASVQAIDGTSFSFPNGVPAFGTTAATTFEIGGTAAQPTYSVASGGNTASGNLDFGSCILNLTKSSFLPTSPLAQGGKLTVPTCTFTVGTSGAVADGVARNRTITLTIGTANSNGVQKLVTISETGEVTVDGVIVGNVTVEVSTGSGPN